MVRDRGVYRLPDGNYYIAMSMRSGGYALYLRSHALSLPPRYTVKTDGRIVPSFGAAYDGWTVDQMEDTGETHAFERE